MLYHYDQTLLQVVNAACSAMQLAADDRERLLGAVFSGSATLEDVKSSTGDASAPVAAERVADDLRCLHVDLVSLRCVLEARHERQFAANVAAAAAIAAAKAAAAAAAIAAPAPATSAPSAGGAKKGAAAATARAPTASSDKSGRAPLSAPSSPKVSKDLAAATAITLPPASPLWHLPPAGVTTWCGENRAWQAVVHLASIEMLPEGADTPAAAIALTSKVARLLSEAAADEVRVYSAGEATISALRGSQAGGQVVMPAPRLLQRTSTSMMLALPASAVAAAAAGQQWMLLGKPFGSGTVVTAANTAIAGTGVALPATTSAVAVVAGLKPNTRYNFAWVWCAPPPPKVPGKTTQAALGPRPAGAISASTPAIVAATSLPLDLLWARLATASLRAGDRSSYATAIRRVSAAFLAVAAPRPLSTEQSSLPASMCLKVWI